MLMEMFMGQGIIISVTALSGKENFRHVRLY